MKIRVKKEILIKVLALALELAAIGLLIYLIALPLYPPVKYEFGYKPEAEGVDLTDIDVVKEKTLSVLAHLPQADYDVSPDRLVIPKIGVNAPIVGGRNADYGLARGAWLVPDTSTPDKGGNTVITGHRFKYLPPHNLTFYLFHKLEAGDLFSIIWQGETRYYRIREVKIVADTDFSILEPAADPVVTLFTCHPIYSTAERLVVIGELLEEN